MDYIIDASGQKLGRLASRIARLLQGKEHPSFSPNRPGADRVIVNNVSGIAVSGRKASQKIYYRHTGYMGHLRARKFQEIFERSPEWALERAVYNMLPKNFLRAKRMKRLRIQEKKK